MKRSDDSKFNQDNIFGDQFDLLGDDKNDSPSETKNPNDYNPDTKTSKGGSPGGGGDPDRRTLLYAAAAVAGTAAAGIGGSALLSESEEPQTTDAEEAGPQQQEGSAPTISDLMNREYEILDSLPGPHDPEVGAVYLGEYSDEIPTLSDGQVAQDILEEQNSELYEDILNESEWTDVTRLDGRLEVYLEDNGSVYAVNQGAQTARLFTADEFNLGGDAYEGPEGESFENLYEDLT